jgi:hypothetical protein
MALFWNDDCFGCFVVYVLGKFGVQGFLGKDRFHLKYLGMNVGKTVSKLVSVARC